MFWALEVLRTQESVMQTYRKLIQSLLYWQPAMSIRCVRMMKLAVKIECALWAGSEWVTGESCHKSGRQLFFCVLWDSLQSAK